MRLDPQLEDLARRASRPVRIRKIDLSDRQAAGPVAQQHGVRAIPLLVLFDGTTELSRDTGRVLELLAR